MVCNLVATICLKKSIVNITREELMADYDFDMGIIGGGSGGLTVSAGAAQFWRQNASCGKENEFRRRLSPFWLRSQ